MPTCKAVTGINNVCGDLLQASGVSKDFYVGYVSDLSVRFSTAQTGPITGMQFIPYNGLIKFEGQKYAHKFDHELAVAEGGSISFLHKAMIKLMALSTQDDVELQRLAQAQDMFIVSADVNDSIFIYAPANGFSAVSGPIGTTGQKAGEDTSDTLNFTSNEKVLPLRFNTGGTYAANIAYLDSLIR